MVGFGILKQRASLQIVLFAVPLFIIQSAFGQLQNSFWYFGDSAGVHFDNGSVLPLSDGILNSFESCSSISSPNGDLLIYSDGHSAYNKFHLMIENGNDLGIGSYMQGIGSSSTNGVTILTSPAIDSTFFILTVESFDTLIGLCFSELDLNQNGGLGRITANKNISLVQDSLCEKVNAVRHANGRDWWVICRSLRQGANRYYKCLLTPNGWEGPFIQDIGTVNLKPYIYYYIGESTFSTLGDKYACVSSSGQIDLFDFDRCTGLFSNYNPLGFSDHDFLNYYGCSFSPGGEKLYVSNFDTLFQFDLNSQNIKSSKIPVWIVGNSNLAIGQHELGPDEKIYFSSIWYGANDTVLFETKNLSVIPFPDSLGLACNISPYSVPIGQGRTYGGLPNNPNYALGPLVGSACDTLGLSTGKPLVPSLKVIPNPSNGKFKIEMSGSEVCARIRVIDVAGRKVWEQETPGIMKEVEMDLSRLAEGTYYVEIDCLDGKVLRSKFIIQR